MDAAIAQLQQLKIALEAKQKVRGAASGRLIARRAQLRPRRARPAAAPAAPRRERAAAGAAGPLARAIAAQRMWRALRGPGDARRRDERLPRSRSPMHPRLIAAAGV